MIDPAQPEAVRSTAVEFATVAPLLAGLVVLAKQFYRSRLRAYNEGDGQ